MSGIMSLFTGSAPSAEPAPVVAVPPVAATPQEDPAAREAARKKREQALAGYLAKRVKYNLTGGAGDTSTPGTLRATLG